METKTKNIIKDLLDADSNDDFEILQIVLKHLEYAYSESLQPNVMLEIYGKD